MHAFLYVYILDCTTVFLCSRKCDDRIFQKCPRVICGPLYVLITLSSCLQSQQCCPSYTPPRPPYPAPHNANLRILRPENLSKMIISILGEALTPPHLPVRRRYSHTVLAHRLRARSSPPQSIMQFFSSDRHRSNTHTHSRRTPRRAHANL